MNQFVSKMFLWPQTFFYSLPLPRILFYLLEALVLYSSRKFLLVLLFIYLFFLIIFLPSVFLCLVISGGGKKDDLDPACLGLLIKIRHYKFCILLIKLHFFQLPSAFFCVHALRRFVFARKEQL